MSATGSLLSGTGSAVELCQIGQVNQIYFSSSFVAATSCGVLTPQAPDLEDNWLASEE